MIQIKYMYDKKIFICKTIMFFLCVKLLQNDKEILQ